MKKIIVLVLALSLTASVLISCGSSEKDGLLGGIETYGDVDTTVLTDNGKTATDNKEDGDSVEGSTPDEGSVDIVLIEGFENIHLLPVIITKDRFESEILSKITDSRDKSIFESFYTLYDISDEILDEKVKEEILVDFPICQKYAIYWCDPAISAKETVMLSDMIKKYCPQYTYDDLAKDSVLCGYSQEQILEIRK